MQILSNLILMIKKCKSFLIIFPTNFNLLMVTNFIKLLLSCLIIKIIQICFLFWMNLHLFIRINIKMIIFRLLLAIRLKECFRLSSKFLINRIRMRKFWKRLLLLFNWLLIILILILEDIYLLKRMNWLQKWWIV